MLCIWWEQEGMVYHELLKPAETITAIRYKQQLMKLDILPSDYLLFRAIQNNLS